MINCLKKKFSETMDDFSQKMKKTGNLAEAGKLSAGVYHDICNILSASNLSLEHIKRNVSDVFEVEKMVDKSLEINNRIGQLLRNYRHCIQGEKNQENFYINQEIANTLSIFNFCLIKNNIDLDLSLGGECLVKGDAVNFFRVIINLLSNAVESFSKEHTSRRISIKTFLQDNNLVLEIADNGCGIDKRDLERIFETFFSLKDIMSKDSKNCGLGLSVVKDIVENNFKGTIEVESVLGQGSSFKIYF